MAGTENNEQAAEDRGRPLLRVLLGAFVGAALVLGLAGTLGRLIEDVADPAVLAGFAAVGAVFGAFAWGTVAYERRNRPPVGPAG